jgi:hypothetical protein
MNERAWDELHDLRAECEKLREELEDARNHIAFLNGIIAKCDTQETSRPRKEGSRDA